MSKNYIILLYGVSATGKTTLARKLSKTLKVPHIGPDDIKECLYKQGHEDRSKSAAKLSSAASFDACIAIVEQFAINGESIILESHPKVDFSKLIDAVRENQANLIKIWCQVSDENLRRDRYNYRINSGQRHPGHRDTPHEHTDKEPHIPYEPPLRPDIIADSVFPADKLYDQLLAKLSEFGVMRSGIENE